VDAERIGAWGTSYGGGHVLVVGAVDRRVKCVVSQVPTISGSRNTIRRNTPEGLRDKHRQWDEDRLSRFRGGEPGMIKALADDNMFTRMPAECSVNLDTHVTLRTMEMYAEYEPAVIIDQLSPTPLLMIITDDDDMTFTDEELEAYSRAREPKALLMLPGDHRAVYFEHFEATSVAARDWFVTHLGR
jgi:dipeptidyl aminopeptidase/acylaminoacyl peptidase